MHQPRIAEDFREILPDFLPEEAILEAQRCLYCFDAPCRQGCPANIDIPSFIESIRTGNLKRAARLINDANPLGSVCGRVCPVERLCEEKCISAKLGKPIQIGMLQRYAMDNADYMPEPAEIKDDYQVAVVGSGPSGLACARELVRNGIKATVFESKNKAGGMVSYGVPQYRCPHGVTSREVERIEHEGVEIKTATPVNQEVKRLFDMGYDAVYIAVGLTRTKRPEMPGLNLRGVYMGLDFLNRIGSGNPPEVGKRAIVVGGGDTALDCARSALRLGAQTASIMYRRSMVEMPADQRELEEALEEGIVFRTLTQPVALHGDDQDILRAVEAVTIKLGNPDASGRRTPKEVKGSNFRLPCNTFIFATGSEPSGLLKRLIPDARFNDKYPVVDPITFQTSIKGVFCGGDVVNRGATVVEAVREGKMAAQGIMNYLETRGEEVEEELDIPEEIVPDASLDSQITEEVETEKEEEDTEEVAQAIEEQDEMIPVLEEEKEEVEAETEAEEKAEVEVETGEEPLPITDSVIREAPEVSSVLKEMEETEEAEAEEEEFEDEEEELGEEELASQVKDNPEKASRRDELKKKWREKLRKKRGR
ncbi:MAG: NAD(P)-dependent oxidoreductase [Vulcanimicrobiota bacterium]